MGGPTPTASCRRFAERAFLENELELREVVLDRKNRTSEANKRLWMSLDAIIGGLHVVRRAVDHCTLLHARTCRASLEVDVELSRLDVSSPMGRPSRSRPVARTSLQCGRKSAVVPRFRINRNPSRITLNRKSGLNLVPLFRFFVLSALAGFPRDVDYCPVGMLFQPPAPGPNHFVSQPVGFASGRSTSTA
jgi:hypothetical protein